MAGKRGKRGEDAQIELNLVPIMALLCVLIPVLLAAFNFFEIKVQAMSVPRMATGKSKAKKTKKQKPLNLTLNIQDNHIKVSVHQEDMDRVGLTRGPAVIPKRDFSVGGDSGSRYGSEKREINEYDYPALHETLVKIKKAAEKMDFKKEPRTINITAKSTIPWRIIARTIAASRVRLDKDSFGTEANAMELYSQAKPLKQDRMDEKGQPMENESGEPIQEDKPLFDAVVFATARN